MKKNITESELKALISESIYEVLNESEFDEGFGHWLGSAFQGMRNKWNNFKNDFKAGQNDAREKNKDYNPYSVYGDREDNVRRMGNGAYPQYRYDLETRRNQQARGENGEAQEIPNTNQSQVSPNPDLQQPQSIPQGNEKMNTIRAQREKEARAKLYKAGLVHQGDYNNPTGWSNKNGQPLNEPQKNLIRNWEKYKLRENKKRK